MSLLCRCIRLDAITPVIDEQFGAEASWTTSGPKSGTFAASLLGGPPCEDRPNTAQFVSMQLRMNGCGRLRFTISGAGSKYWDYPYVTVVRMAPAYAGVIAAYAEGGFQAGCETAPLLHGLPHPGEVQVCCGQSIEVRVYMLYNEHTPDLEITVDVEVIA